MNDFDLFKISTWVDHGMLTRSAGKHPTRAPQRSTRKSLGFGSAAFMVVSAALSTTEVVAAGSVVENHIEIVSRQTAAASSLGDVRPDYWAGLLAEMREMPTAAESPLEPPDPLF